MGALLFNESVSHPQDTRYQHQKIVTVLQTSSGGGQDDKSGVGRKILLEKLFPDWPDRVDFQKNQQKLFDSGRKKLISAKRVRVKINITPDEQDAFDYFSGTGFYKKYQSPETFPNKFDTWKSFLKKMNNLEMRTNFLNSYNQRYKKEN